MLTSRQILNLLHIGLSKYIVSNLEADHGLQWTVTCLYFSLKTVTNRDNVVDNIVTILVHH